MARGFESKDVESQQLEREAARSRQQATPKSPAELERERRLEDLNLNRTRVLTDLQVAANPRYRALLGESLRFLDNEIARLTPPAAPPPAEPPRQ